jgi:hypothetical protein
MLSFRLKLDDYRSGKREIWLPHHFLACMKKEDVYIPQDRHFKILGKNYADVPNLVFLKADIAKTGIKSNSIDFTVCDQVIMHTEDPEFTFKHLSDITKKDCDFACYVYRKKALPRELVDDYFRTQTHNISSEEMWKFSDQLTELGKRLTELNVKFDCPDIPVLGIKGGEYDIQRFIYWNFLKCFYKPEWSKQLNDSTNYDWYAPSNAKRFTKEEFEKIESDKLEQKLNVAFENSTIRTEHTIVKTKLLSKLGSGFICIFYSDLDQTEARRLAS